MPSRGDWGLVQPEIARATSVCGYDHAGRGCSDPGPSPRTARQSRASWPSLLSAGGMESAVGVVALRSVVSTSASFASDLPRAPSPSSCSSMPPTKTSCGGVRGVHNLGGRWTVGIFRLLGVSFGRPTEALDPSINVARATDRLRISSAADEIMHIRECASEVRTSRRRRRGCHRSTSSRRSICDTCNEIKPRCLNKDVFITAQSSGPRRVHRIIKSKVIVDAINLSAADKQRGMAGLDGTRHFRRKSKRLLFEESLEDELAELHLTLCGGGCHMEHHLCASSDFSFAVPVTGASGAGWAQAHVQGETAK